MSDSREALLVNPFESDSAGRYQALAASLQPLVSAVVERQATLVSCLAPLAAEQQRRVAEVFAPMQREIAAAIAPLVADRQTRIAATVAPILADLELWQATTSCLVTSIVPTVSVTDFATFVRDDSGTAVAPCSPQLSTSGCWSLLGALPPSVALALWIHAVLIGYMVVAVARDLRLFKDYFPMALIYLASRMSPGDG